MEQGRRRVLITGINGLVGGLLRERLGDRYEISGITRQPVAYPTHVADVADLDAILPAFAGIDSVVHMAGTAAVGASWDEVLRNNISGVYNVYEAAHRQGVGQVIFASSNHAVSWWEAAAGPELYDLDHPGMLDEHIRHRPDSLYGWSKAAGEDLGRHYADVYGLRVLCLRIGWVLRGDDPLAQDVSGEIAPPLTAEQVRARLRAIWLSHRDCAELVRCCIEADDVRYGVYYGISANPRQYYDLSNAREQLGYVPQDSAPAELGEAAPSSGG